MLQLYADSCLKGFAQTVPPVEEWDSLDTIADMNGGNILYPEFTCSGTLNSVTIPYSIKGLTERQWENNLELTLAILRKNVGGYYVQVGEDILLQKWIGYQYIQGNVTKQINMNIQKHDILLLTGRKYYYYIRHIPALLTTYEVPGSTENATLPMIHVDFTQQTEGDPLQKFMCESALNPTNHVCLSILHMYSIIVANSLDIPGLSRK